MPNLRSVQSSYGTKTWQPGRNETTCEAVPRRKQRMHNVLSFTSLQKSHEKYSYIVCVRSARSRYTVGIVTETWTALISILVLNEKVVYL